jgi:[acyl-carrier-protein] S-malonyltransferase
MAANFGDISFPQKHQFIEDFSDTMKRAFVFPGQGSQAVGMGKELAAAFAAARQVFEEVDDALDDNLTRIMFDGPEDELVLTENAQPALMAVSLAVLRTLEAEGGTRLPDMAAYVAGHSLGEYSALAAACAIPLAAAARLLRLRGLAMQRAVPVGEGAMTAVLGLELDDAVALAEAAAAGDSDAGVEPGVCAAANDNAPGQVVLSGNTYSVEYANTLAKDRGAKRVIMLPVSAPFHCALMAPAAAEMAEALDSAEIRPPLVPVVANVSAQPVSDPATIKKLLVEQVTKRVRWRECVETLAALEVETLAELGVGKVLTGLTRRIDRSLGGVSVQGPADIEAFLKSL